MTSVDWSHTTVSSLNCFLLSVKLIDYNSPNSNWIFVFINFLKSGRDKFCWNCHEKCLKIACPKCFRSFHRDCLKSTDKYHWNVKDKTLLSCTVCTVKEMSKEASVGM